jgi:AraC-like DNA-binding protein
VTQGADPRRTLPAAQLLRWQDLFAFIGPLGRVGVHRHRATALLLASDAPFRIRAQGACWQTAQGAIVPPGLAHELDCGQQALAVIYFDPVVYGPLATQAQLQIGSAATPWVRAGRRLLWPLLEYPAGMQQLRAMPLQLVHEILPLAGLVPPAATVDARLLQLHAQLGSAADWQLPLPVVADRAGLSRFRFSHLFSAHTGGGWTAYRNWMRLLQASSAMASSRALTEVALEGGYSSAAHFSASFRSTFGITPSQLRQLQPQLIDTATAVATTATAKI